MRKHYKFDPAFVYTHIYLYKYVFFYPDISEN